MMRYSPGWRRRCKESGLRIMGKGRLGKNNLQTWEEIELRYETTIRY
jgi:hypothetical protein